jgi:diguanylate cyclase (GGDEF)-like protein
MFSKNKLFFLYFLSILFLVGISLSLVFQYENVFETAINRLENIEKKNVATFGQNIEEVLKSHFQENLKTPLVLDEKIRLRTERVLSILVGEQYQYLFVIARDEENKYRYVLDASRNEDEKGEYQQKFDPESDSFEKAFLLGEDQWHTQKNVEQLWVTYLKPVKIDGKVAVVIAIDFSKNSHEAYRHMFAPLRYYLLFITLSIIVVLLMVFLITYFFIKQKKQTFLDELTQIYNRHYLKEIENKIKLDQVAVAILDIDFFKNINDTYGHKVGDVVLRVIVNRVKNNLKENDCLIRYGGEEFLIIFKKDDKDVNIENVMKRIHKNVCSQQIIIAEKILHVTFSVGLNLKPEDFNSLEEATSYADKLLYKAKNNGRNRVETSHI